MSFNVGTMESAVERGAKHVVDDMLVELDAPTPTAIANAMTQGLAKSKLNLSRQISDKQEEAAWTLWESHATLRVSWRLKR